MRKVGGGCRVEPGGRGCGQSPGDRDIVGQLRWGGGSILSGGGRLATCHAAMRATLSFAAASLCAVIRSGGRAIPRGEQTGRQTGGAQACQQARHEQLPDGDRKSAHNYPTKYTPKRPAGLAELSKVRNMGQIAGETAPLANWRGGDDNHAFRWSHGNPSRLNRLSDLWLQDLWRSRNHDSQ